MGVEEWMKAGRELDALVAERVMGWVDFWHGQGYTMGYPPVEQSAGIDAERHPVPSYSTDIAAAWQVVETMRTKNYEFEMFRRHRNHLGKPDPGWTKTQAIFRGPFRGNRRGVTGGAVFASDAHAICVAALDALDKE